MASTRDKNSKGNYCLEQRSLDNVRNNLAYYNGPNGHAANAAFPALYRQGYMPPDNFSHNPTDIESSLLGIGSTNLVNEKPPTNPDLKDLPTISFFERPKLVSAKNVYSDNSQRPFII